MLRNPKYLYSDTDFFIPMGVNFGEYILERLKCYGDRIALINATEDKTITFNQIFQRSINLSVSLSTLGLKKGQCVAICSESQLDYFCAVIAASVLGAVVTTFTTQCTLDEMKHQVAISKPVYLFCTNTTFGTHGQYWKSLNFIKKIILFSDEKPSYGLWYKDLTSKDISYEEITPETVVGQLDTAFILYSSGTTGLPKGVKLSHYNAIATCCSYTRGEDVISESRAITVSPWYHAMGLWGVITRIAYGRTVIFFTKYEEKVLLRAVEMYKPTYIRVPPPIIVMLAKSPLVSQYDMSSVKFMYSGAAPLDLDVIKEVKSRIPSVKMVIQGYGMTESVLAIAKDSEYSETGPKEKSVGKPCCGSIIKIVDIETRQPLDQRARGEILIKGPTIMQGYVGKGHTGVFDSEGFYISGDIGYYDEEGYLYVVDRLKELIKYKGFQVPPAELEAVLLQHPAVRDAAVIGKPDRSAGELPMAFVVLQSGKKCTEDDIVAFVNAKVSNPKKLRGGVKFIDQIPKNPSGKILRKELRKFINQSKL